MIAAVVLAAGLSQRMGAPKLTLPWGKTTVIGQVVAVLREAKLKEIILVTGGASAEVAEILHGEPVRMVYNPDFRQGEMLSSCQLGLRQLAQDIDAALIVLGDQPQIQAEVIQKVIELYQQEHASLVVPSYHMHRGHPWLVRCQLWQDILSLREPDTLRDFLNRRHDQIVYVPVETDSILKDLDTPADYKNERPG